MSKNEVARLKSLRGKLSVLCPETDKSMIFTMPSPQTAIQFFLTGVHPAHSKVAIINRICFFIAMYLCNKDKDFNLDVWQNSKEMEFFFFLRYVM